MGSQQLIDSAYDTAIKAAIKASDVAIPYWPNPDNPRFDRQLALEVIDKEGTGNYATVAGPI
jgi:hypothetical protein